MAARHQRRPSPPSLAAHSKARVARLSLAASAGIVTLSATASPLYVSDVAPILRRHCVACHSATTQMGGLAMDSWAGLQQGGTRGPAIVAGDPEASPLYLMVAGSMEPRMPFSAEPLGAAEIALLRGWIEAGAGGPPQGEEPVQVEAVRLPDIRPAVPAAPQIFSVDYSPRGGLLATGRHGGVTLRDDRSGQAVSLLDGLADIARAVSFSADGLLVAGGGGHPQRGGHAKVWQLPDGRELAEFHGHADTVQAVAFSPDGRTLATGSYDKDIKLWDVASGRELRTLRDHIDAVYAVAFTPDGTRLVSGSADRSVKVWDPLTGERLFTLSDPTEGINSIAVHPGGARVAAAGYDRTIRVWQLAADGGTLLNALIAHRSPVLRVAYSPDGSRIVTAAADRTVKIFDGETLAELASLDDQPDWVMSLAFSPDGGHLAAGRFDGSLSIYDTQSYRDRLNGAEAERDSP